MNLELSYNTSSLNLLNLLILDDDMYIMLQIARIQEKN